MSKKDLSSAIGKENSDKFFDKISNAYDKVGKIVNSAILWEK